MDEDLKRLYDRKGRAWNAAQELMDEVRKQDAGMSGEQREKLNKINEEMREIQGDIDSLEELRKNEPVADRRNVPTEISGAPDARDAKGTEDEYRAALNQYMRYGERSLTIRQADILEKRVHDADVQNTLVGSEGGYLVDRTFQTQLQEAKLTLGGLYARVDHITTSNGETILWPTVDDTANEGELLHPEAEVAGTAGAEVSEEPIVFGQASLGAFMYSSKSVALTRQILQDSSIGIEGVVTRLLAARLQRIQERHLAVGTGTNQPQGLSTGAVDSGIAMPSAGGAPITFEMLLSLQHSIDEAYRANALYAFNDTTFEEVRLIDNTATGLPAWQPSFQVGAPDLILGKPYVVDNYLQSKGATGRKPVLYGDFREAYLWRTVTGGQLVRLVETRAKRLQVEVFYFERAGGVVRNNAAYRALVQDA